MSSHMSLEKLAELVARGFEEARRERNALARDLNLGLASARVERADLSAQVARVDNRLAEVAEVLETEQEFTSKLAHDHELRITALEGKMP